MPVSHPLCRAAQQAHACRQQGMWDVRTLISSDEISNPSFNGVWALVRKLGIAVIGLGTMGLRRIESIQQNPNARVVSVCDSVPRRAESTGAKLNCFYSTEPAKAVDRSSVDCILVCTPNRSHKQIACQSLSLGKHVFCEKPMATSVVEAEEMVRAAKRAGVFLKVGSNHRFFPNVTKCRDMIGTGLIGEPLVFRGWIGHGGSKFGSDWFLDPRVSGGGTLIDNGCHILDISRWLMGEVVDCFAVVENLNDRTGGPEDYAAVTYRCRSKRIISISSSWIEWYGYLYFEVFGREGFVIVDARSGTRLLYGKRDQDHVMTYDYTNLAPQSYRLEMEAFIDGIRAGREPLPNGDDGLRVIRMIHAAYGSSKTGRQIEV